MANKVSFSGESLDLQYISSHWADIEFSLRNFFGSYLHHTERFTGYTITEVTSELEERLAEESRAISLSILASIEAAFRVDYLKRVYAKEKDNLSRECRDLYSKKENKASLEDEIFEVWVKHSSVPKRLIGDLRGAFKYRHWLAHGRYWTPKLGRKYDYYGILLLASEVFESVPFIGEQA